MGKRKDAAEMVKCRGMMNVRNEVNITYGNDIMGEMVEWQDCEKENRVKV